MQLEFKFTISLKRRRPRELEGEEQFEHRDTDSTSERSDEIAPGVILPVAEPDRVEKRRVGF